MTQQDAEQLAKEVEGILKPRALARHEIPFKRVVKLDPGRTKGNLVKATRKGIYVFNRRTQQGQRKLRDYSVVSSRLHEGAFSPTDWTKA